MPMSRRALLGGATLLAAPAILHRPAQAAEFSYKFGSVLPPDHPMIVRFTEAAQKIKDDTGGQFEIAIYPSSALGQDTAMVSQVISGALQMYSLSGDLIASRVPAAGITGVGFAFPDYDKVWAAMDGDLGEHIRMLAEKVGLYAVPKTFDHGFRNITTKSKPITTVADLQGMKLRLPVSPTAISLFQHLGASPTPINFGEVYSALQTGVVDGQENPLILIDVAKFYEVQKYVSLTNHNWAGYHVAFNMAAWKKLPPKVQEATARRVAGAAVLERADWVKRNEVVTQHLRDNGMVFNTPAPESFRSTLKTTGYYGDMQKRMGPDAWTLLEKYVGPLA